MSTRAVDSAPSSGAGIKKKTAKKKTATSATLGKTMPPMQTTPHVSDTPGWCSDESKKLSAKAIAALDAGAGNDLNESDLLSTEGTAEFIEQKKKGDRALIQYFEEDIVDGRPAWLHPDDSDIPFSRLWMVEDAQAHVTKYGYEHFGKRLEAMHAAVNSIDKQANAVPGFDSDSACDCDEMVTVLLLGAKQPICRQNAIPALTKAGIVIQRREA